MTRTTPRSSTAQLAERPASGLRLERPDLVRIEQALSREWLEVDGRGGYACSSTLLCPTRRQHGLLVVVPDGMRERHLFLSRFEESLSLAGKTVVFSYGRFRGTPDGGDHGLESFELAPWPRWRYRFGLAEIEREVCVPRGQRTVLVRYRNLGERSGLVLRLRALTPFRRADDLTFENIDLDPRVRHDAGDVVLAPYPSLPQLRMRAVAITSGRRADVAFEADPVWYRAVELQREVQRGEQAYEDSFSPGWFETSLEPGAEVIVLASIEQAGGDPQALWEASTHERLSERASAPGGFDGQLDQAARAFLVQAPGRGRGIAAAYPWFAEQGRDTFVSLPGLTLARGLHEQARELLLGALPFLRRGLLPSHYAPTRELARYEAADPALWFALAAWRYTRAVPEDTETLARLRPALRSIADAYSDGTELGLHVDDAGMLRAGDPGRAVTWMDAYSDGVPVTPRDGSPVELAALWSFLLAWLEELGDQDLAPLRRRADRAFLERFWLDDDRYLADVWRPDDQDRTVRPNQIIAAALPYSPLSIGQRSDVVVRTELELRTPAGLRTLSPESPLYRGRYPGDREHHSWTHHQGSAWRWLVGYYVEASLRAFPDDLERIRDLGIYLDGFHELLDVYGLGFVSGLADGDPPHRPGGTIARAMSVAELIRARALLERGLP